jgi:RNA polymerase sigma-70 factor (ECF subfamily)
MHFVRQIGVSAPSLSVLRGNTVPDADNEFAHPDTWRAWLDRHEAALLLLARQHLASREEAQDAVQDGFVRFWKSRQRARDPVGFLFACVRSAAVDLRRARTARRRRERAADVPLFTGPREIDDRRRVLEAALGRLPREQREVLVLKVWSELTFVQIALALGISANTAASRYRYGIARLQASLSPEVSHE